MFNKTKEKNGDKGNKLSTGYLIAFIKELKQLMSSGITANDAIDIIRSDESSNKAKPILDKIYEEMNNGCSLGDAIAVTSLVPNYISSLISLAEQTGHIEDVLNALIKYYTRQEKLVTGLKSIIITPIILLITMICVLSIIVIQVLPIFNTSFNRLGIQMGWLGTALLNLGIQLVKIRYILLVIGMAFVLLIIAIRFNSKVQERFIELGKKIFHNTRVNKILTAYKFTYSMSLGISSGLSIDGTLDEVEKVLDSADKDLVSIIKKELVDNPEQDISDVLVKHNIIGTRDSKLLKIAQKTGNIAETMEDISDTKTSEYMDSIINKLEPSIILITSIITGSVLLSIMIPLLNIISTL